MWHLYETSGEDFGISTTVIEISGQYGLIERIVADQLAADFPENFYEWREVADYE